MPLQKSFSDTNHSNRRPGKDRQQWSRNRSFQGPQTTKTNNTPLKPLQEKPPLPVSTSTKNKLSAFQFSGQNNAEKAVISLLSDDEKENKKENEPIIVPKLQPDSKETTTVTAPAAVLLNSFPSTPAGRLALPDLIGMGDVQRAVQDLSPEDRIEWDLRSSNSQLSIKRGKKRARSSSPASSPAAQAAAHFNSKGESVNTKIDSGSDLWGRYSLNGATAPTPQGATIPALANIMLTSSPQTSRDNTPRSGMFRRTNSCGTSFPKRRRIGSSQKDDIFTESANIGPSKLSVLIGRVQEGLTKPKPAPENKGPNHKAERMIHLARNQSSLLNQQKENGLAIYSQQNVFEPTKSEKSSGSDYGDFDEDDLDASLITCFPPKLEEPLLSEPNKSKSSLSPKSSLTADGGKLYASDTKRSGSQVRPPRVPKPVPQIENTEEDEFHDSDEDLYAAGLDDMVASFDKSVQPTTEVGTSLLPNNSLPRKRAVVVEDSDDEFGDGDLDIVDFQVAELTATQSIQPKSNSVLPLIQKVRVIQRYSVTNFVVSEYETSEVGPQPEKILFLQCENTKTIKLVNLRGAWFETPVTVNAYVHVLGVFGSDGRCIIDDNHHMIILHPDHLISSTALSDSFDCIRKAVLQDRVKATSSMSAPLIYGTILHEIFQAAMLANQWDTEWLDELINNIATRHIEDLYTIRLEIPQAVEYLRSKMPELQSWAALFVASNPKPDAIVRARHGETANMCVSKLLDVEEHVWSPMYGLKGNIDATVQVTMSDRSGGSKTRTLTVPFEVKSGKNSRTSHHAQTVLYNLLLSDRYDINIAYGILYYMETSETIRIPTIRNELCHMIMQRNELACFVRERHAQLPPMLKKENTCNRCYAKETCFIYHKLADDGTGETSAVKDKFDAIVKHLTPKHKEFFLKWDDLITKEEKESMKFRRELWTMLSSEREGLGRCFSNVIIEPGSAYEEKNNPKINRYRYNLIKETLSADFSFLDSQINVGEAIVISDELGHFALAKGFVTHVKKKHVTVAVDRRLHNARIRGPGFDELDNQVFASIMEVAPEGTLKDQSSGRIVEKPIQYRLDKDEYSNGMAQIRNNLIQVMKEGPFGSREVRSLVVDLQAPRFKPQSTAYILKNGESINVDQRRAISKVMSAQDYALVLGMPGTGKTTTIAHIIRALVSQGKSVLLTSYTHTAVDNILLKLRSDEIPILRIGNISKINSKVQEFATLASKPKSSFQEIRSAWHATPIVATTCLGISHAIFNERTFDYCIVDEASQITLPTCIGPIRLARTFVLVGDHYQLPPLVQNEEAREGGLDISLFKHLSDEHPSSVVYLRHQYRMCEDVMTLSNNLIYNGRLKCGTQEVADRRIAIPNMDGLRHHHYTPSTLSRSTKPICTGPVRHQCWIRDLLDPDTRVSFINTDPLLPASREEAKGRRIVNNTEATICVQLVESLLSVGVSASDIGVMTHYRSQLKVLKEGLRYHTGVDIDTADRFQGRDKDVIIISLVRSNDAKSIGELLKDWRRINVAFTRAKTKLLVIGSRETLKGNGMGDGSQEMVARFVSLMELKGWVYDLPPQALERHVFETGATQASTIQGSAVPGTQWQSMKVEDGGKRRRILGEVKTENGKLGAKKNSGAKVKGGLKQPEKRVSGQKPFKIPRQSALTDIYNEVSF